MLQINKDHIKQNLVGLTILFIVGVACWPLAPTPNTNPSGILLPTAPLKTAISSDQVQVLEVMPPHAQNLGIINTKLYYATLAQAEQNADIDSSMNLAKQLAAQAGANGVVINQIGATMGQGPLNGVVVEANAVSY